ncbi:MAG: hypothetical protein ACYDER_14195 [Ktedonobacteraceae bacterium]
MNLFTQAVLYWTLLGLLLVWMVVCAILALRPEPKERVRMMREEAPAPSNTFAFTTTPAMLQVITPQSVTASAHAGNDNNSVTADSKKASVM